MIIGRTHVTEEPPLAVSERARLRELEREVRELPLKKEFLGKPQATSQACQRSNGGSTASSVREELLPCAARTIREPRRKVWTPQRQIARVLATPLWLSSLLWSATTHPQRMSALFVRSGITGVAEVVAVPARRPSGFDVGSRSGTPRMTLDHLCHDVRHLATGAGDYSLGEEATP
jgi:hypothetical protein